MPCPSHSSQLDHLNSTDRKAPHYVVFPLPSYLVPLRPKYSPQHPIFRPTFLPQCEWPSFTPIQNKGKIIVLYFLIFIFLDSKLQDKILHQMVAHIPWLQPALNFFLNRILIFSGLFPNIWTAFQRKYYQSLYCGFVVLS
jgi:hypothetical protein